MNFLCSFLHSVVLLSFLPSFLGYFSYLSNFHATFLRSVVPLIGDSLAVLMQRQPKELDDILPSCFHKVKQIDGVYSVQEPHFWTLCSEVFIGALKLEVAAGADTKYILSQTHNIFTAVISVGCLGYVIFGLCATNVKLI